MCVSSASTDLCGGCGVTRIPTATRGVLPGAPRAENACDPTTRSLEHYLARSSIITAAAQPIDYRLKVGDTRMKFKTGTYSPVRCATVMSPGPNTTVSPANPLR